MAMARIENPGLERSERSADLNSMAGDLARPMPKEGIDLIGRRRRTVCGSGTCRIKDGSHVNRGGENVVYTGEWNRRARSG